MTRTAVIAGQGALAPAVIARLDAPPVFALDGFAPDGVQAETFRLERLVPFLDSLLDRNILRVVFAGAIRRPRLDPELFDPRTAQLVPRIMMAMQSGDDGALRTVLEVFEDHGLTVASVAEVAPDLIPGPGLLAGDPSSADRHDAARAMQILQTLGPLDMGQGAVVAQGQCLAVETLPGTAAMLGFAARHRGLRPDLKGGRGVFVKAPKPGQDLRIDMPVLGPDSVAEAADADLAGIAWAAGGVILLDRAACIRRAHETGLFLWAMPPA